MGWGDQGQGRGNQGGSQGGSQGGQQPQAETKEYKWTELGSLWEGKDGVLTGRCFNAEAQGESAIHEHRRLGYMLAAISRGDRVVLVRNKDKERDNQPDFKLLLVKNDEDDQRGSSGF
jgi:hypothetical protein